MYGFPQGLVLGPLLFNIDMIDLVLEREDNISSHWDDTTSYSCAEDIKDIMSSVIIELQKLPTKFSGGLRIIL